MRKQIGISLQPDEFDLLKDIADTDKRSRSSVVAKALSEYAKQIGVDKDE